MKIKTGWKLQSSKKKKVSLKPHLVSCSLVGGFKPFEKYIFSQNGSFPQIGGKTKNIWNHHLVLLFFCQLKSSKSYIFQ